MPLTLCMYVCMYVCIPSSRNILSLTVVYMFQLDLVCKRSQLAEFSQTLVILGQAIGASCFTPMADKFGRRIIHVLCHIGLFVSSLALSFSQNYVTFAILRFLIGAFQQVIIFTTVIFLNIMMSLRLLVCLAYQ